MAANVESMFYVGERNKPWHGLGTSVENAPTSADALIYAGLDWNVIQKKVMTDDGFYVPGYKANVRQSDQNVLGIVTDRYTVVQNAEAFAFTDSLIGEGVTYETAGSLRNGKRVWILAKLPDKYSLMGDEVEPYLVFTNSHDGSSGIKVAMTPIRVVCQNTLNLALGSAKRCWSANHVGNVQGKIEDAKSTLFQAQKYMTELGKEAERLNEKKLSDKEVTVLIDRLIPMPEKPSFLQVKNVKEQRDNLRYRFYDAPDLQDVGMNAYRFVNAVSDFATHSEPLRKTGNYKENLFSRTLDGHQLIDKAYQLASAA